ncbi:MAG: tyrosine-type recombinase/integrase, partial [Gemmatimonadales bacterium]
MLFDAYRNDDLDGLRARLSDLDLAEHIPGWEAWLTDRVKPTTADHYRAHLRSLIPDGQTFWRSGLTAPAVARWLAARTALVAKRRRSPKASRRQPDPPARPVSASTKRRYLAAVHSFVSYLREMGILTTNPLRDLQAPPPGPPRCQFLELPDVLRLIEGSVKPYRAIFALAYGAGLEISAILARTETDVDYTARTVRARGTKAWNRDRLAYVADWAWPFVERHLATLLPGERVFRGIDRWKASDYHRDR